MGVFELGKKKRAVFSSNPDGREKRAILRAIAPNEPIASDDLKVSVTSDPKNPSFSYISMSGSVCPFDNLPCKYGAEFISSCDDVTSVVVGQDITEGSHCERAISQT